VITGFWSNVATPLQDTDMDWAFACGQVWLNFHFTDISRLLVAKVGLIWSNVATPLVEYLYYYVRWCASLQPPTICAKSSSAYNA
jgi:hypothetical protein